MAGAHGEPAAPGGPSAAAAKWALRARLLAARREARHDGHDAAIREALRALLAARAARTVAAYVPMEGEPGGPSLPEALAAMVPRVLLPVVLPDRDLDWAVYTGPDGLVPAALGLREQAGPRLGRDAVERADVLLVPALAVDGGGARLGRGGGSFDRVLAARRPGLVLALLYPGELTEALPVEPHDRRVDGVVIGADVTLLAG